MAFNEDGTIIFTGAAYSVSCCDLEAALADAITRATGCPASAVVQRVERVSDDSQPLLIEQDQLTITVQVF